MRRFFPFFLLLLLAGPVFAQEPAPLPKGVPISPISLLPTPVPPAASGIENDVVKISTTLVQLDVTVTDKDGRAITDIKPDEVEIYENGQKQDISYFTFISRARREAAEEKKKKEEKGTIPVPPQVLRPDQVRRTIALVVDDLTLSFESANRVRNALKKFVDEQMQDGDLVGIIRTGAGMGALQQFTSDKRQLYAAIERVKWNGSARGRFGSFGTVEPTMAEKLRAMGDSEIHVDDIKQEKDFNNSAQEFRDSVFTTGTLGALKFIVGGMKELPGRKSVVLFSEGFKLFSNMEEGASYASRVLDFMKDLIADANRAAVVFYTIDTRGLETTNLTAADSPIFDPFPAQNIDPSIPGRDNPGANLARSMSEKSSELFETQQGLVYLAKETGGFPVINQNDISRGVSKILDDQSYYLVAYEPDAGTFDPNVRKFNKIEIKVKRDGARVRYRSGFFTSQNSDEQTALNLNPGSTLMKALVSPFAVNGIDMKLNALFGYSKKRGYYVHSFLHIDANDLQFKKMPNGEYQTVFDILAISYGDNGQPFDKNNVTATLNVKEDTYRKFLSQGFAYSFIFPVKKPGAYQMRVALVERGTNKMGSANQFVEIPNLKKEGLTLSGVVLENMTALQWNQFTHSGVLDNMVGQTDPIEDTSKRRFKRGTVLRFGVEVYNSKLKPEQMKVSLQARLYKEGQLVYQSKEVPIGESTEKIEEQAVFTDAVMLGKQLEPGDYIVQVVAIESEGKRKIATQWVQFEVVE